MPGRTTLRRRIGLGLFVTAAALSAAPLATGAPGAEDPREEREQARARQAEVAADLDTLRASDAELERSLAALDANVAAQEARLADARHAADQAEQAAEEAAAEEKQAEAEVAELRDAMTTLAVDAYVHPPGEDASDTLLSEDLNDAPVKKALLDSRSTHAGDLLDQYRAAREDLERKRDAADQAAADARAKAADIESRVAELDAARAQQRSLAAGVDERIDAKLAESAALEQLDQQLSSEIAEQQKALARQVRVINPGGPGDGGGPPPDLGPVEGIVSVRGIQVAASIADELEGLLSAADADGVPLSGSGYRDPQAQIELRKAHCGTSYYAIYEMPASECTPPTAKPGTSMHEKGLAIDFTSGGKIITSRSSTAFQWLAANAGRFGFANLPSEPWHWSVNGQ